MGTQNYEGWRSKVYKDSEGYDTVGYGHKLTPNEVKNGTYANGISKAQGSKLFNKDFGRHKAAFYGSNPGLLKAPDNVKAVLGDLAYNMGPGFLKKFPTMKAALGRGDYAAAGK